MKIMSVNVGQPRNFVLDGIQMQTSMVRQPQSEIFIEKLRVRGDLFSSPQVHGTPESTVYSLSAHRFPEWSKFLGYTVTAGHLGENLTLDFQNEEEVMVGDEFQVGTARLRATGPRYPCNRLNFSTGHKAMQKEFEKRAWPGVYYEVLQEGHVRNGDDFSHLNRVQNRVSILDVFLAMRDSRTLHQKTEIVHKVLQCEELNRVFVSRIQKGLKEP